MTTAFSGIYLQPSSNSTGQTRLFVKYSAEQVFASDVSHLSSGTEVLIHFEERGLGSVMTYEKLVFDAAAMIHK